MADPSDKGHALRWLRAQEQPAKRDFIVSLASADVHLAMEAVERVELRGDFLTDAIKPCLDANVAAIRRWLYPLFRVLGSDRYLALIEELVDDHPARAVRAMCWLEPHLHNMSLVHYHKHRVEQIRERLAEIDRPDNIDDWLYPNRESNGDSSVT